MKALVLSLGILLLANLSVSQADNRTASGFNDPGYCYDQEECLGYLVTEAKTTRKYCLELPNARSWWNETQSKCENL